MTDTIQNENSRRLASYLTESVGVRSIPLMETTLHRVFTKHAGDGFFIISASRNEYTDAVNSARTKDLEGDIRALKKYSYLPVTGGFVELKTDPSTGAQERVEVTERAFLVMSRNPIDRNEARDQFVISMLDDAKALCAKWDQESVLVQLPGGHPMYLTADGTVDVEFDGTPTMNDIMKVYFTKLHRGGDKKLSDMGTHGRVSFRTLEDQLKDEKAAAERLGLATNGPSGTINGNHSRMLHGDLSEEVFREGL